MLNRTYIGMHFDLLFSLASDKCLVSAARFLIPTYRTHQVFEIHMCNSKIWCVNSKIKILKNSLHPTQVPGRMGLLITLYLISTNVYGSTEAPPNRGFSNIELWITGTQICILLAILEYSIILALKRINISLLNIISLVLQKRFSLRFCFTFFFFFNLIYWIKSTTAIYEDGI